MKNKLKTKWHQQFSLPLINYQQQQNDHKENKSMNDVEKNYLRIMKKLDIFDLGYMIMHLCLANFHELLNLNNYTCEHDNDNIMIENEGKKESSCCCFYHCVERSEENAKSKIKMTSFINKNIFSESFVEFLCITTSYKLDKTFSFNKIKNQPWIHSVKLGSNKKVLSVTNTINKSGVMITFEEFLILSKAQNLKKENMSINNNSLKRFERICDNLSLILTNCEHFFKYLEIKNLDLLFDRYSQELSDLSLELGVGHDVLINKLKDIYGNAKLL
jgi:hypothetical protein